VEDVLRPVSEITFEAGHCPDCGELREAQFTHMITGDEPFLHRTLANVGVPPLHILRAHNGYEYRFYELKGDLEEALHFRHFEQPEAEKPSQVGGRIQLKDEVQLEDVPANPARDRIRLKAEEPPAKLTIKPAKKRVRMGEKPAAKAPKGAPRIRLQDPEPAPKKSKASRSRGGDVKVC
jgi:hypothetical protein